MNQHIQTRLNKQVKINKKAFINAMNLLDLFKPKHHKTRQNSDFLFIEWDGGMERIKKIEDLLINKIEEKQS